MFIVRRKGMGVHSMPIAAEIAGLKVFLSDEALPKEGLCFRWGTTCTVPSGLTVVNPAKAISRTSDKRGFRLLLAEKGLSMKTWGHVNDYLASDPQIDVQAVLIRPEYHSRSEGLYLCKKLSEVVEAIKTIGGAYYISEFIQKKNEYRVFVAQNRVVWMIRKKPKDASEVSWGCVEEGAFDYIGWSDWDMKLADVALKTMKESGLDYGAIDIVEDFEGRFYTLEVNTAPQLGPYYSKCLGKVMKYIVEKGKEHLPDAEELVWKKIIHPAIWG